MCCCLPLWTSAQLQMGRCVQYTLHFVRMSWHVTPLCANLPGSITRPPSCRQIWGTGIDPTPPPCFATWPKLHVYSKRPPVDGDLPLPISNASSRATTAAGQAHAGHEATASHTPALLLTAALVAAAAVTAAASKAIQRRWRQQPNRPGRQLGSSNGRLLQPVECPSKPSHAAEEPDEAVPLFPPALRQQLPLASVQRRARVVRQLQRAMSVRGGAIELMQLPELHAGLAHCLEGGQRLAATSRDGSCGGSTGQLSSRQWGLGTESLRLHPGELEVSARPWEAKPRWHCAPVRDALAAVSESLHSMQGAMLPLLPSTQAPHCILAPCTSCTQLVKGADGLPLVIGEGAHAVVMLGRLQGMEVAVKVRML